MEYQPEIKLQEKLSELLMESDSSGAEVAREIGVSPASISQYRKGETQPSLDKLVALARALDVSLDYLVLGESEEAEEVSVGPIAKYMDQSLQEMQIRTAQHSALVAHIGRRLSKQLDDEIEKYLSEDPARRMYAGIVTNPETLSLEQHSDVTRLLLRTFHYNLLETPSETPGEFFMTVANNLSQGRKYQYLLPQNVDTDWSTAVGKFRNILIDQINSESAVRNNCSFRVTSTPIFTGCVLYQLSVSDLEEDDPLLYDFLYENDYINPDSWFGYVSAPSLDVQGVMVMDDDHLSSSIVAFEQLWNEAEPI